MEPPISPRPPASPAPWGGLSALPMVTPREWLLTAVYALGLFGGLGTLTALWPNPLFTRMTPVTAVDYAILAAEALLVGMFLSLRRAPCPVKGAAFGGILGFQGFACSICNKILLLLFGGQALLTWYEPYRYWVGAVGIALLLWVVAARLRALAPMSAA